MSNSKDFLITSRVLKEYRGPGGDVIIPAEVHKIADNAFNPILNGISITHSTGRQNIRSIVIPEGVSSIGTQAFANCKILKNITFSKTLKKIGDNAFRGTAWLASQQGHVIVNSIYVTFNGSEREVTIPDGVTSIADEAFYMRQELTTVRIPESVVSIGTSAFSGCNALSCISIPENISQIGAHAFKNTPWLKNQADDFIVIGGILYRYQGSDANVHIPDGVVSIGDCAFYGNDSIQSVTLPKTKTSIGENAFGYCEKQRKIQIPDAVYSIKKGTFISCSELREVLFSRNVKTIEEDAFYRCEKLNKLPDLIDVEMIGDQAFYGCKKLKDHEGLVIVKDTLFGYYGKGKILTVPDHVTQVSSNTLENQFDIKMVIAAEAVFTQLWNQLDTDCKHAVAVNCLKEGVLYKVVKAYIKRKKDKFFSEIIKQDSVPMMELFLSLFQKPDLDTIDHYIEGAAHSINLLAYLLDYKAKQFTVDQIDEHHVEKVEMELGFKELTSKEWKKIFKYSLNDGCICISGYKQNDAIVEIPTVIDGHPITSLSDGAFKANQTLEQIILPDGITTIGHNAFKGCSKLHVINIPESVKEIGASVFEGCVRLTECILPDGISDIGCDAFKGCSSLQTIRLPKDLRLIRIGLFDGCYMLNSIEIPETVKKFYDYAFRDCKALTSIKCPHNLTSICMGAFTNCRSLEEVYVPDGLINIGLNAFRSCTKLKAIKIPEKTNSIDPKAFNGCKKLTIHAPAGSYAAAYAERHKIPFVSE